MNQFGVNRNDSFQEVPGVKGFKMNQMIWTQSSTFKSRVGGGNFTPSPSQNRT
jgi:hypothetical protein